MVAYKGASRFYSRSSRGKHPLDVREIRAAFTLSTSIAERLKNFRVERLGMLISNNDVPLKLDEPPHIVLHIAPLSAFDPTVKYNLDSVIDQPDRLMPMGGRGLYTRHNFDGYLTYSWGSEAASAYLQIFRNGIVESVRATYRRRGQQIVPSEQMESDVIEALSRFLRLQKDLGVEPPLLIMLSLLGVAGYHLTVESLRNLEPHVFDRDALIIPEVLVENFASEAADIVREIFDVVWNAAGYERCRNYDATTGKRIDPVRA
jgi:hypothetical protein